MVDDTVHVLVVGLDSAEGPRIMGLVGQSRPDLHAIWCRDGLEAVEFVFGTGRHWGRPEGHLRLVLLDEDTPVLDGYEVLRRIRSSRATNEIRVIFLRGRVGGADSQDHGPPGATVWLAKPVTADGIARGLRAAGVPVGGDGWPT